MFNFDITFTHKNTTCKIVNNEIVIDKSISAQFGNALINYWLEDIIIKQVNGPKEGTFDAFAKDVAYLNKALETVISIKSLNCSYRNKDLELLKERVREIKRNYIHSVPFDNIQQLALHHLAALENIFLFSTYELEELYSGANEEDTSRLDALDSKLENFDYRKYGLDKDIVLQDYRGRRDGVRDLIRDFRILSSEAKEDLVNWSTRKINKFFKDKSIQCNAGCVRKFIREKIESLEKKGICPTPRVETKKDRLELKMKNNQATQEDYFEYFKIACDTDSIGVLGQMTIETLIKVLDSPLKCLEAKKTKLFRNLKDSLLFLSKTTEHYHKIFTFLGKENLRYSFMLRHEKDACLEEVKLCLTGYMSDFPKHEPVKESFYDKFFTKISKEERYCLSIVATTQYLFRMSNDERVSFLQETCENQDYKYDSSYIPKLYKEIPFSRIKEFLLKDRKLAVSFVDRIIEEEDIDTALFIVQSQAKSRDLEFSVTGDRIVSLFNILPYTPKKRILLEDMSNPWHTFKEIFNREPSNPPSITLEDNEWYDLFEEAVILKDSTYTTQILTSIISNFLSLAPVERILQQQQDLAFLAVSKGVNALSSKTKLHLLSKGFNPQGCNWSYYSYEGDSDRGVFFKDFNREELLDFLGPANSWPHKVFLGKYMTKEELEKEVSQEIRFWNKNTSSDTLEKSMLRNNLQYLQYSFLKKFKDKNYFKSVVGDRRNYLNARFGQKLLDKLQVTNSLDFMFSD